MSAADVPAGGEIMKCSGALVPAADCRCEKEEKKEEKEEVEEEVEGHCFLLDTPSG